MPPISHARKQVRIIDPPLAQLTQNKQTFSVKSVSDFEDSILG